MGGKVIAEVQSSCVIYGMSSEVIRRKLADFVIPLDKMAEEIIK
jgi:two-component system chemotaxis response regulator CheB